MFPNEIKIRRGSRKNLEYIRFFDNKRATLPLPDIQIARICRFNDAQKGLDF